MVNLPLPHSDRPLTLAVVGDVHDQWSADDANALYQLGVDLVLFVGDFGNESVDVVRAIAALELPKAVIFGNHDAWYTASSWGKRQCPYDRNQEDRVQQQLDLLGDDHVGYGCRNFPTLGISVVGARPFSWGGSTWKNRRFYRERFGVTSFTESTAKIIAAANQASTTTLIVLGHSGPLGLGDRAHDPCGKDWQPVGGDYGDPDLAQALVHLVTMGKHIPLVAFGHMHHRLRHSEQPRISLCRDAHNTFYLNAASVPRIITVEGTTLHNFSLVSLHQGQVNAVCQVWVDAQGTIVQSQQLQPQLVPTTLVSLSQS